MLTTDQNGRRWRIWQTADKLEEQEKVFYPHITPQVVSILRSWGETWAGKEGWMSLLDKGSLFHEIQECIVAIHNLDQERIQTVLSDRNTHFSTRCGDGSDSMKYIALDVCAGKGLFSFLLSYLKFPNLEQIVMLEKATINWHHIHEANKSAKMEGRPEIMIWSKTNLHEYDSVLNRILNLPHPVAMTGIHLCKQLSPSFCGLVNGLGKKCIQACLAPCCLPRAVTAQKIQNDVRQRQGQSNNKTYTVSIQLEESAEERQARKDYMERRERVRRKPLDGPCFLCGEENHNLLTCTVLPTLAMEAQIKIRQDFHAATVPCWNCLEYGHFRNECPQLTKGNGIMKNSTSHPPQHPPTLKLDVAGVLKEERPFFTYCHLLAQSFQMAMEEEKNADGTSKNENSRTCSEWKTRRSVDVVETNLEKSGKHDDGNWNSERKSIFLIIK